VAAAAADAVRLVQPRLHHGAGLGECCVEEVVAVERQLIRVASSWVVGLDLGRHVPPAISLPFSPLPALGSSSEWCLVCWSLGDGDQADSCAQMGATSHMYNGEGKWGTAR
jgi:hypothetical protein